MKIFKRQKDQPPLLVMLMYPPEILFGGPLGFLKLNFDVAVNKELNLGATVVITRDANGSIVDWKYSLWPTMSEPLVLECLACKSLDLSTVLIDGDSSIVISSANGFTSPLSIQGIISDIGELCNHISDQKKKLKVIRFKRPRNYKSESIL